MSTPTTGSTPFKRNSDRGVKPAFNQVRDPAPVINVRAACAELSQRFTDVTRAARNNSKGTHLYDWQVEFSYIIDNIMRGPKYIVPKYVSVAHHMINTIDSSIKSNTFNNVKPVVSLDD